MKSLVKRSPLRQRNLVYAYEKDGDFNSNWTEEWEGQTLYAVHECDLAGERCRKGKDKYRDPLN